MTVRWERKSGSLVIGVTATLAMVFRPWDRPIELGDLALWAVGSLFLAYLVWLMWPAFAELPPSAYTSLLTQNLGRKIVILTAVIVAPGLISALSGVSQQTASLLLLLALVIVTVGSVIAWFRSHQRRDHSV